MFKGLIDSSGRDYVIQDIPATITDINNLNNSLSNSLETISSTLHEKIDNNIDELSQDIVEKFAKNNLVYSTKFDNIENKLSTLSTTIISNYEDLSNTDKKTIESVKTLSQTVSESFSKCQNDLVTVHKELENNLFKTNIDLLNTTKTIYESINNEVSKCAKIDDDNSFDTIIVKNDVKVSGTIEGNLVGNVDAEELEYDGYYAQMYSYEGSNIQTLSKDYTKLSGFMVDGFSSYGITSASNDEIVMKKDGRYLVIVSFSAKGNGLARFIVKRNDEEENAITICKEFVDKIDTICLQGIININNNDVIAVYGKSSNKMELEIIDASLTITYIGK